MGTVLETAGPRAKMTTTLREEEEAGAGPEVPTEGGVEEEAMAVGGEVPGHTAEAVGVRGADPSTPWDMMETATWTLTAQEKVGPEKMQKTSRAGYKKSCYPAP